MNSTSDKFYGYYELVAAELYHLPKAGSIHQNYITTESCISAEMDPIRKRKIDDAIDGHNPDGRIALLVRPAPPQPPPPPPPPPPPIIPPVRSIGVMDIGQGNCNLLFDQANEPIAYFDLGYPLYFYVGSSPADIRFGHAMPGGPIKQKRAGQPANLFVVLSHWDWDHWRLGRIEDMHTIPWIVPRQPLGQVTLRFSQSLTQRLYFPPVGAGIPVIEGIVNDRFILHQCVLRFGDTADMLMNNTGIAMKLSTNLPSNDVVPHDVVMTGDANFNNIQALGAMNNIAGIEAVHHGSNNHGASQNLPNPVLANNGRIFYSYGLRLRAAGNYSYSYGFPVPQSILDYQAAGWVIERSAAEDNAIRAMPTTLANRGNIRVGNNDPLNAAYNNTAFFNYRNTLD